MFGGKTYKKPAIRTIIAIDTRVMGNIEFSGGFHIDGYVKGNMIAAEHEDATLSISEKGCVEGTIEATQLLLNGTVKGDIRATERVELGPKARVIGNVKYKTLEMALGAEINGQLIHESVGARKKSVGGRNPVAPQFRREPARAKSVEKAQIAPISTKYAEEK